MAGGQRPAGRRLETDWRPAGRAQWWLFPPPYALVASQPGPCSTPGLSVSVERRNSVATGSIFAAGLDVYENEPRIHPDLVDLPNALLLPHIASATVEDREDLTAICVDNVISVLAGREPRFVVPPPSGPRAAAGDRGVSCS